MSEKVHLRPARIEYKGPEGCVVWADEDGVHVRIPAYGTPFSLEMQDMKRLIALYESAYDAWVSDESLQPRPPNREQIRDMRYQEQRDAALHSAVRAIKKEVRSE